MAREYVVLAALLLAGFVSAQTTTSNTRPRASDLGLKVGILPTGRLNAITDVAGVEVGHTTVISGNNMEKVPGAIFVGNGFGRLAGSTQVDEMSGLALGRWQDAPVDARNLRRLAARAWLGMARTGSAASNGSGDYAIAFSTAPQLRIHTSEKPPTRHLELLNNDAMSPLFLAVIEATEEAIYNSMFRATTMSGNGHTVEALPIDKTIETLREHRCIK